MAGCILKEQLKKQRHKIKWWKYKSKKYQNQSKKKKTEKRKMNNKLKNSNKHQISKKTSFCHCHVFLCVIGFFEGSHIPACEAWFKYFFWNSFPFSVTIFVGVVGFRNICWYWASYRIFSSFFTFPCYDHWLIHSFIHLFSHSLTYSFNHSFTYSFTY